MATNDTPAGFHTGKEILEAQEADALRFCEECEDWNPHDMDEQGAYICRGECEV
jgi:hypothetical protein